MEINYDMLKILIPSVVQVFLGFAALRLSWVLHKDKSSRESADLRLKLYEKRYKIFLAFERFVKDTAVQDIPRGEAISQFTDETTKLEFLFGEEISRYRRELLANAVAIIGIEKNIPRVMGPPGIVGYFPGSTIINTAPELRQWFIQQLTSDLRKYFIPYLNFEDAGVSVNERVMSPPNLPDLPLMRRPRRRADQPVDKP